MKSNIGTVDSVIRLLLAALVAVLCFNHQIEGTPAIILAIAAAIVAVTAVFNFCPLYRLFGISTRKKTAQS